MIITHLKLIKTVKKKRYLLTVNFLLHREFPELKDLVKEELDLTLLFRIKDSSLDQRELGLRKRVKTKKKQVLLTKDKLEENLKLK